MKLKASVLCIALAMHGPAIAAGQDGRMLDAVLVTASKVDEPQRLATQRVSVVYAEEGEQIVAAQRNLTELLRHEPGMFVNPLSCNDANWGSYGGIGPKYNSLLVDGLPIDAFVDPMALDALAVERVESHRGPASVLYGNYMSMDFAGNQSPLAGISNFVLKDRIDGPATRASLSAGSWSTVAAKLYHQNARGNLHYFLGASHEQSDYTGYGQPNSWLDTTKDPEYRKQKLYGKATLFLDRPDHALSFFANYADHDGDVGRPNRDFHHRYGLVNLAYRNQIDAAWNLSAKIGWRSYDRRWDEDNYPANLGWASEGRVKQTIVPADVTLSWRHGKDHLLSFGADTQHVDYRTSSDNGTVKTPGNDMTARSYGLFAQERLVFGDWVLRAGVRTNRTEHDYTLISGVVPSLRDQSWTKTLWSSGVRYNLSPRVSLYANAGSSFTPPSAKSVGGTIPVGSPANGQLPNPSLKPESGRAYDIGADFRPTRATDLNVRLFENRVEDAIVENVVSAAPSQTRSGNAGTARSRGVELALRHSFGASLDLFANTTFTDTRVRNPYDARQDGSDLSFVPHNITNLGVTWRIASTTITPYLQYVGRYYDSTDKLARDEFGRHTIANLRVKHELQRVAGARVDLFADLYNLGDRRFNLPWMFRDVGFSGMLGVEAKF